MEVKLVTETNGRNTYAFITDSFQKLDLGKVESKQTIKDDNDYSYHVIGIVFNAILVKHI